MCEPIDKCTAIAEMARRDNLDRGNKVSKPVHPKHSIYLNYVKRLIDIVVSLPIYIILLPVNLVLGIISYFDVGRPILFKQQRTGKDGKPFNLIKFRNMTNDKDEYGNLLPANQRVTKFGKFVRKYSLDELLNFGSILLGDMSLIGPRPLPVEFEERYSERHKMRCAVKPGLECPCIDANNNVRFYQEQFENDIWYVEHASFIVDCRMVLSLFRMVFNSKERSDHASVGGGYFVGYNKDNEAFSMRRIPEKYETEYQQLVKGMNKSEHEIEILQLVNGTIETEQEAIAL